MTNSKADERAATELPEVIEHYLRAHDAGDTESTLSTIAPDAVVTDDGRTARGHDEIRRWLDATATDFTFERHLLGVASTGAGDWVVSNNITGNFPGGTVDLTYRFTLKDGLIEQLVIAP